ncbi:MAG TPA: DCC1-like thiol-disulfide oxidoreductase family protein [Saprospiraceae bacterium]|nr:DCC1-like thiol-disulfide oxidoreductase family protein [Saprospiraceae bacterium]
MKIIFYDGLCPMCNGWVRRFIAWDRDKVFRFAALESDKAKEILSPVFPDYLKEDTIIFYDDGKTYVRSDAIFHLMSHLRFPFKLMSIGRVIPRFFRDGVYRYIARHRYRFGPRYESCPIPPKEWRDRFIG